MKNLWLKLTLLDDAVLSERSATAGGHRTLDYLPGAVLLGAVAARSYAQLDEGRAFRVFHSGHVRFGAACPATSSGDVTIPTPLSSYTPKGRHDGQLVNRVLARRQGDEQLTLAPLGFRDGAMRRVHVQRRTSMRTSVADDGRAREGHLYTLSAVAAGTVYLARVDADHDDDLALVAALHGEVIRVGKSRSAEFGGVRVEVLERPPACEAYACSDGTSTRVHLLVLSDLVLRTPEGAPTFVPTPAHFGLPADWSWSPSSSFVRTRSWSPFNATRRRPTIERQAVVAGSVLTFEGASPIDLAALRATLDRGVGDGRAEGLGRVLVQPRVLVEERYDVQGGMAPAAPASAQAPPSGELFEWLGKRHEDRLQRDLAWSLAIDVAREFGDSSARLPRAQWGELRQFARQRERMDREQFVGELKRFLIEASDAKAATGGAARKTERRWGQKVRIGGQVTSLASWLVDKLDTVLGIERKGVARVRPSTVLELVAVHAPRMRDARANGADQGRSK